MSETGSGAPRRLPIFKISLLLILLFTFAPLISVLLASAIAAASGCPLNEGSGSSCLALGGDIGGVLHSLFVAGWYALFTLPLGVLAILVWGIALIVWRSSRR